MKPFAARNNEKTTRAPLYKKKDNASLHDKKRDGTVCTCVRSQGSTELNASSLLAAQHHVAAAGCRGEGWFYKLNSSQGAGRGERRPPSDKLRPVFNRAFHSERLAISSSIVSLARVKLKALRCVYA